MNERQLSLYAVHRFSKPPEWIPSSPFPSHLFQLFSLIFVVVAISIPVVYNSIREEVVVGVVCFLLLLRLLLLLYYGHVTSYAASCNFAIGGSISGSRRGGEFRQAARILQQRSREWLEIKEEFPEALLLCGIWECSFDFHCSGAHTARYKPWIPWGGKSLLSLSIRFQTSTS